MSSSEEYETQNTANSFAIAGELNIHSAVGVQRNLLDALAGPASELDLSGVEACDAIGLQLLLSAKKSGLRIAALSPVVAEAAEAVGISIEELKESCKYPTV